MIGRRKLPAIDVELHAQIEQPRCLELRIATVSQADELLECGLRAKVRVFGLRLSDRGLVRELAAIWHVVVPGEDPRLVRQGVEPLLNRTVEV